MLVTHKKVRGGAVESDKALRHSGWNLFRGYVGIGLQSFGGGATTLYLMRRVAVEEQQWLSDVEYTEYWGMVQIAPGINLLGQTVLIGYRVNGFRGAIIALVGLLLPSATLTIALTAGYAMIRTNPQVAAAVHGIIPATVGVGCVLALQMLKPALDSSRAEGLRSLWVYGLVVIGAPLLLAIAGLPAILVLWGAGIWCAVGALWIRRGAA